LRSFGHCRCTTCQRFVMRLTTCAYITLIQSRFDRSFCFAYLSASRDGSWRYVVVCTLYILTDSYFNRARIISRWTGSGPTSGRRDRWLWDAREGMCRVLIFYCIIPALYISINIPTDQMQSGVYACMNSKYLHPHNLAQSCTFAHVLLVSFFS
jgi:hypothetical protein